MMTAASVLKQGFVPRREKGDAVKLGWLESESRRRYDFMVWTLEARRANLRTANRKYRRQCGMTLKGA